MFLSFLRNLSRALSVYAPWVIIATSIIAFFVPPAFAWVHGNTQTFILGLIMLTMGLTLTAKDFRILVRRPADILLGTCAQFFIMPGVAWCLVHLFHLEPALALGILLVGCCPGGVSSNIMSYLCRGDVAFSVGMTCASTLLAPVMTPLLMQFLAGEIIHIAFRPMFLNILIVTVIPVALGTFLNQLLSRKRFFPTLQSLMPGVGVICLALIVGAVIVTAKPHLMQRGIKLFLWTFLVVFCHNGLGYLLGWYTGSFAHFSTAKKRTISIEVGMQNAGLGTVLASNFFAATQPLAVLPCAISCAWHSISGTLIAAFFLRGDQDPSSPARPQKQRSRKFSGRALFLLLLAFLLLLLAAVSYLPETATHLPREIEAIASIRIGEKLRTNGICASFSFDGNPLFEEVSHIPLETENLRASQGITGNARRFARDPEAHAFTRQATWQTLGNSYSLMLRFRLRKDAAPKQQLLVSAGSQEIGFSIHNGIVSFSAPVENGTCVLSAAEKLRKPHKNWHSLLAVADAENKKISLYLDGRCVAEKTNVSPVTLPKRKPFGIPSGLWYPPDAHFDQITAWSRPLTQKEIFRVSNLRYAPARTHAPLLHLIRTLAHNFVRFTEFTRSTLRELAAAQLSSLEGYKLPSLDIALSEADERHFAQQHDFSLASGQCIGNAVNWRDCRMRTKNGRVTVKLCLSEGCYHSHQTNIPPRPSFLLAIPVSDSSDSFAVPLESAPGVSSLYRIFRLFPPEAYARFYPDSPIPFSLNPRAYVYLRLGGAGQGIYHVEEFCQFGGTPIPTETRKLPNPDFAAARTELPASFLTASPDEQQEVIRRFIRFLCADPHASWGRYEWYRELQNARKRTAFPPFVTEKALLGKNHAAFFITSDLDVSALASNPAHSWSCDRPELLDLSTGKISPPETPQLVTLTPAPKPGSSVTQRPLQFRLIPKKNTLPALFVYADAPFFKHHRSNFIALYQPPQNAPARLLPGFTGNDSGIKHRGNTSYVKGAKKGFSIRFDRPHGIHGPDGSRTVFLLNGYSDKTKLRNFFCYEIFREFASVPFETEEFGTEAVHHEAPEIAWTELFLNGKYMGVYEMCSRIDTEMFPEHPETPLFKIKADSPLFAEASVHAFTQQNPSVKRAPQDALLRSLLRETSALENPSYAAAMRSLWDTRNVIDFFLFVNFTGNFDGRVTNFVIGREPGEKGRFFFVPWDYDKTFFSSQTGLIQNTLMQHWSGSDPAFKDALWKRWQQLRRTTLSREKLHQKVLNHAARLRPYMRFEEMLLAAPPEDAFDANVEELLRQIDFHLTSRDTTFHHYFAPPDSDSHATP